jgi:tRNA nucleotidyltransferase (CCA-adding enzyme)
VVVGASPEALVAQGYLPVGRDFPVFLHPHTREEYALARTERKTGRGYHGFAFHAAPDVTLDEDLARRDLTINAMAEEVGGDGTVVDPYGGRADLAAKVLRHVGPAFAEDPVRILRLARFAARFADFAVAPETLALMRAMVADGEADHLVPERVWQEVSRGLMEAAPSRMLRVLRDCGALARLAPEIDALFGVAQRAEYHPEGDVGAHLLLVVDRAAARGEPLPVRFAALCHDLGKGSTPAELLPRHHGHEERGLASVDALCARWKVPTECRDLARLCTRYHGTIHRGAGQDERLTPATFVKVLEHCDAFRRPERFRLLLDACACDAQGRLGHDQDPYAAAVVWERAGAGAAAVDGAAIARQCQAAGKPATIPERLHEARVAAVARVLAETAE